jgi:hypothetical protein
MKRNLDMDHFHLIILEDLPAIYYLIPSHLLSDETLKIFKEATEYRTPDNPAFTCRNAMVFTNSPRGRNDAYPDMFNYYAETEEKADKNETRFNQALLELGSFKNFMTRDMSTIKNVYISEVFQWRPY